MTKKVSIYGASSEISKNIIYALEVDSSIILDVWGRKEEKYFDATQISIEEIERVISIDSDYYLFNLGVLYPKRINEQTDNEIYNSVCVNLLYVVRAVEFILEKNKKAKIFIIGSESGKKGSYDTTYFLCKSAMKKYVEEKRIKSKYQQLVLFSPSTIEDAGMTIRRTDTDNVERIKNGHPKKRFLKSKEVSDVILSFFEPSFEYITNTEIEINGGKFARMF